MHRRGHRAIPAIVPCTNTLLSHRYLVSCASITQRRNVIMDNNNLVLYYACLRGIATTPGSKTGQRKLKSKIPIPLAPNYIREKLGSDEEAGYKAAGVLPIAFLSSARHSNEREEKEKEKETEVKLSPYVLLGTEDRMWELSKKKQEAATYQSPLFLNILGGKRENVDKDAAATGVREFIEESGNLLEARFNDLHSAMHHPHTRVFWNRNGKYALFLYHVPNPSPSWLLELPEEYEKLTETFEMAKLYWIPLKSLLDAFKSSERELSIHTEDGQPLQILKFMSDTMRQAVLRRYLEDVLASNALPAITDKP